MAEAKTEYQKAYLALDEHSEYRRLVEVKLSALGVNMATQNVAATAVASKEGSK